MTEATLTYRFIAQTDRGLARDNNEDAYSFDQLAGVAVLADGMGGYNAGEVASNMATTLITREVSQWLAQAEPAITNLDIQKALEHSVHNANQAIYRAAQSAEQYSGMGTTLVVGVFRADDLILGFIGDSRCYRLRQGELLQISRDHSLVQEQIDAGLITRAQAAVSLNKNLVTRALGVEAATLLEVHEHKIQPGDIYLMCSDGLTDMVSDEDINKILQLEMPLEQRAQSLIEAANARGGRDNITVLLAQIEADSKKRGLLASLLSRLKAKLKNTQE